MQKPWPEKYCPKTLEDVQGHTTALAELKDYILNYKNRKKKSCLGLW
ncbi:MAG: hypothetical protein ABIG95_03650 [Candidatus Woesearchaeota archaeon]